MHHFWRVVQPGIPVERYVAYEIEPSAIKISEKNYPQIEHCGDVFEADFSEYKSFDLLIGGSPCTFWSVARTRGGRETTSLNNAPLLAGRSTTIFSTKFYLFSKYR